ncbi:hypothetical protein FRC02_007930 [Tulasnella sp. 418]|nr:hypothetical protein FRC02_007930 [Tulasnella sp. 418]
MTPFQNIFIANLVHTPTLGNLEILSDYLVAVDSTGIIQSVHPSSSVEATSILESHPEIIPTRLPPTSFLLPTFVDLHLHAPQFLYLGTGLHLPLMEWLDQYAYKAEERLDADPELARRVYTRLSERLIEAGTGTVLAFGTIKEETNLILAEVLQSKGLRGFVGKLSMDQSSRPTYVESSSDESLKAAKSFIQRCRSIASSQGSNHLIEPVITPRFVPTCSDELLAGLGNLAQIEDVFIHSHLAEARDQVDWVRSTRGTDDINVFEKYGLHTQKTVQAHCTFLDTSTLPQLRASETSVAHCPLSNAYFSSRPFPLREALDLGVKVGLGSDVAGGYQIDLITAMRYAVSTSRIREGMRTENEISNGIRNRDDRKGSVSIDWKESLFLATRGGSVALGLSTGQFCIGSPFDAQQVDLTNEAGHGLGALDFLDGMPIQVTELTVEKWWCLGNHQNRSKMWVQGTRL